MKTGLMATGIALAAALGISFVAFAGPSSDTDGDGIYDALDNCSTLFNAAPEDCDTDNDGYGNKCDGDFNEDYTTAPSDFDIWFADFTSTGYDGGTGTDMNCDGYVQPNDFDLWFAQFTSNPVPGPSGLYCAGAVPCDI